MENKDVLTDAFKNSLVPIGLKFQKPTPKPRKTMLDYAKNMAKKRIVTRLKSTKHKSTRKRLPSIKKIKKQAWDLFSLFIRARDKKCVLCGSVKGFSAGHLISIQRTATKFDENNVFGLCSTCNFKDRFVEGYHDFYVSWYIEKYGGKQYTRLVSKSTELKQYKRIDYEELIKKYDSTSSLSKM